ncbi:MAG: hypothetical protein CMO06_09870 [Thalassospira sp.]|uniref:hypothetical protein n=1 Tax=Thalassospira sp. TaxID=1912094 RepID=UPI000C3C6865|nr:hypothetical protein [Thalassospira sp.]MAZ33439.1 hypothetical protein [Thalassospira sp.]|tara:strand:- start:391 stop:921 length:531 start_codon:yes stop_codon:yes gene_type:complete
MTDRSIEQRLSSLTEDDIVEELQQHHRDALLDLVLVWGGLDGALGILLADVVGLPLATAAEMIGTMPSWKKFNELIKLIGTYPNSEAAVQKLKKLKKNYEKYSVIRNQIAHSKCLGYYKHDPQYVLFAKFEKTANDQLALDCVPLQEFATATRWGQKMHDFTMEISSLLNENNSNK